MKVKLLALTMFLLSFVNIKADAQETGKVAPQTVAVTVVDLHVQKRYNIFFEKGRSEIDTTFKDNGRTLRTMREDINTTLKIDGTAPESLLILSTSSPDGVREFNRLLASKRAKNTEKLLLTMFPQFKNAHIDVDYLEEDWDGLKQVLLAHQEFPQRERMLSIIDDQSAYDNKEAALRTCEDGWAYLVDNHIYSLRNSSVTISVIGKHDEYTRTDPVAKVDPIVYSPVFQAPAKGIETYVAQEEHVWKKTILQARTNLLVPGMNVGVEIPIKNNWSVGLDYYFPWIEPSKNTWCGEMIGGFIEGKYWFNSDKYRWTPDSKLKGHAVGLYAGLGYYDFQNKTKGSQGEFVDVGVDYTFGLPVAKGKLRIEFNFGLGWILTYYRPYTPSTDFSDLIKEPGVQQRSTNYFGPTRAGVSLAVPITVKTRKSPIKD